MANIKKSWWTEFFSNDDARVATGTIIACWAALNGLFIVNWNFFVLGKPMDTQTIVFFTTLIGLGGWRAQLSQRGPISPSKE